MPRPKSKTKNQQCLIRFRYELGWNQAELAHALQVALATVGRWESSQEPSSYYWGKLNELAVKYNQPEFAAGFLRAQLERMTLGAIIKAGYDLLAVDELLRR